jgi:hypothetical protein
MTKYRWDEKGEAGRQDHGFRMTVRNYPAIRRTPMTTVISEDKRQFTIGLDLVDRVWLSVWLSDGAGTLSEALLAASPKSQSRLTNKSE